MTDSNSNSGVTPPAPIPLGKPNENGDLSERELQQETVVRERAEWTNQTEFILSCISMAVGLGNFWKFPMVAFENGGGAFLIPYLIVVMIVGRPIYFLELCLGQFSSNGQIGIWQMAPLFKGVGITTMISAMCVVTYYTYVMALTLHYLFASIIHEKLPWSEWKEEWNENKNMTFNMSIPEMYFKYEVVKEAEIMEMSSFGYPDWKLALCLIASWVINGACLIRGVKSSGKLAYFTAIIPYIVMGVLICHSVTLRGGLEGILYFITPRWEKLLEPKVWFEAVVQTFYSLNIGFGPITMCGSHNPFRHNLYRSSIIITIVDTGTSLLAGFVIFATLGNLAAERGTDVSLVVSGGGPGLVFITYADALAKFGYFPKIFSILFFFMLFLLGLGSSNSTTTTIVTVLHDTFPDCMEWKVLLGIVSLFGCTIGMIYATPGGLWVMELVTFYSSSFVVFTTTIIFLIGATWVYGIDRISDDVEFMLGRRPGIIFKISLKVFIPSVLITILICLLVGGMTPTYQGREYPLIAIAFGWGLAIVSLMMVPVAAIHSLIQSPGFSIKQKFLKALNPTSSWGPRSPLTKMQWKDYIKSRMETPQQT